MNFLSEKEIFENLEENLNYLEKIKTLENTDKDILFSILLYSLYYCNCVNLKQKRESILKIIHQLGYDNDIRFQMIIDKPYLYVNNNTYHSNSYFIGYFSKDIVSDNKNFYYRYQYNKYNTTNEYFKNNKTNIDFVIRSYKDILLNTTNENLKKLCIENINNIFENYNLIEYLDPEYIRLVEIYNNSDSDLVSIILTSYNQNNYIENAISSILNQMYSNIELIIMDDCSNKFDIDYYKEYIINKNNGNISRLLIVKNKVNLGTVSNIHKGVSLSTGKFIKFLGSYDMLFDDYVIKESIEFMIKTNSLVLGCKEYTYDNNMNKVEQKNDKVQKKIESILKYRSYRYDEDRIIRALALYSEGNLISMGSTFFEAVLFRKYRLIDERYLRLEDMPIFKNLILNDIRFEFLDMICIKYRLGGISSRSNPENNFINKEFKIFFNELFSTLDKLLLNKIKCK